MYESPVNIIYGEMQTQIEGDIFKAIQNVGIDVNKEELLKALQYDREQYSKGYSDGYKKGINKFIDKAYEELGASENDIYAKEIIIEIAEQLKGETQ